MDLGVLILVFDLRAAFFDVFSRILEVFHVEFESPRLERKIPCRLRSGIEMLMPPLHRRHKHAHPAPFDATLVAVFAFRPKVGISRARQHDDMSAGSMAMRFFIL